MATNKGVFVIYTGGTIGSMPKDMNDPDSPQVVVSWNEFMSRTPELSEETIGFRIDSWSFPDPLDSCNIGRAEWQMMADKIGEKYKEYEGFVILHGTDSMVYTASALSFMLANLAKPVVITGAQRAHLFQVRNDALQNIITAVQLANPAASRLPTIPEVVIAFGQDVLRGNRTRKKDANGYAAYQSPKFPPLAKVGANIVVDETRILPLPDKAFYVRRNLDERVITFDVFPGIQHSKFAAKLLSDADLRGVVVRAYGAGNIPTDPKFLAQFEAATKRGVTVLNVTQCTEGRVELGLYETSNLLLSIGMVSGTDLTPEAALVKLMIGLGDEDINDDPYALRDFLQTSQAGEQSTTILEVPFRSDRGGAVSAETPILRLAPSKELGGDWDGRSLEAAQLRLIGAKIVGDEPLELEVYANLSSNEAPGGPDTQQFAGSFRRSPTEGETILAFDVTNATKRLFSPGQRSPFTIVVKSGDSQLSWTRAELALFVKV
ncbi:MAG: asparaginase [Pseudomonadota bacterium]